MAKTGIIKLIFILFLVLSLIFAIASLITSAWRTYENETSQINFGLLTHECFVFDENYIAENEEVVVECAIVEPNNVVSVAPLTVNGNTATDNICDQWIMVRNTYEKVTAVLMITAIIALIGALIDAFIIQKLWPKLYWIPPILAVISAIFLLLSIIIYSIKVGNLLINPTFVKPGNANLHLEPVLSYHLGHSFWLAFIALCTTLIAAIFGFMAAKNFGEEHSSRHLVQNFITSAMK
uniref:Uncharacterized protein n=1 Tax=Panagrolaimus sp. ES5 TaxID=591445 RepID=A0AC34FHC9_9BILA